MFLRVKHLQRWCLSKLDFPGNIIMSIKGRRKAAFACCGKWEEESGKKKAGRRKREEESWKWKVGSRQWEKQFEVCRKRKEGLKGYI